jgi:hypothetical protein
MTPQRSPLISALRHWPIFSPAAGQGTSERDSSFKPLSLRLKHSIISSLAASAICLDHLPTRENRMSAPYTAENPSPQFRELERIYASVHEEGLPDIGLESAHTFDGASLYAHIAEIRALARQTGARTMVDYGSGKGAPYKASNLTLPSGEVIADVKSYWGVESITCYDPGVKEYSTYPVGVFDGLVCTDVLEHIPEPDIPWFLDALFALTNGFLYANIASYPARKILPNGWNAHVTIRPPAWWRARIAEAAARWPGKVYRFKVLQRRKGMVGRLRKLVGLTKWQETTISGTGNARGDSARERA